MHFEPLPSTDVLIPRQHVPRYIPVSKQTLARWAHEGRGPRFVKLGRKLVAYRASDLHDWLADQAATQTK